MKLALTRGGALNKWKENSLGSIENGITPENSAALDAVVFLNTAIFLNTSAFRRILQTFLLQRTS